MERLKGRSAVITGGADGIGRAIAVAMAQEGADVFVGDVQDELGRALAATNVGITYRHCDVSKPVEVAALVATAEGSRGALDILVNNAGIAIGGMKIHEMTYEQWDKQIAVNQTAIFYALKAAMPGMLRQKRGSIINLASMQAHVGIPGWTAYAGTKGAAISMTQQLAVEFAPSNIRVNSISPGAIQTAMNDRIVAEQGEQLMRIWQHMHPLGRIGQPEEVAMAAVFLASDESSFITGIDLRVDGGVILQTRNVEPPKDT